MARISEAERAVVLLWSEDCVVPSAPVVKTKTHRQKVGMRTVWKTRQNGQFVHVLNLTVVV